MAVSEELVEHVREQLAGLGPVAIRGMFGGAGVYCRGVMFALLAGDLLYFKADDQNRPDFEAAGLGPFMYEAKGGRKVSLGYYEAPSDVFDDADEMVKWARKALDAALRARANQPPTRRARTVSRRR